jgi:hypothetical protein
MRQRGPDETDLRNTSTARDRSPARSGEQYRTNNRSDQSASLQHDAGKPITVSRATIRRLIVFTNNQFLCFIYLRFPERFRGASSAKEKTGSSFFSPIASGELLQQTLPYSFTDSKVNQSGKPNVESNSGQDCQDLLTDPLLVIQAASLLNVSVDQLLDHQVKTPRKSGPPSRLQQLTEQLAALPRRKQKAVVEILEGYLKTANS